MIKVENIVNTIEYSDEDDLITLLASIYGFTSNNANYYPNYKEWFYEKLVKGIPTNERTILFIRNKIDNKILGISFLKHDNEENKICSLYVDPNYRNLGFGSMLLSESMRILKTTKPFITISNTNISYFTPFIIKYDWDLLEVKDNYYKEDTQELCFNGTLKRKKELK